MPTAGFGRWHADDAWRSTKATDFQFECLLVGIARGIADLDPHIVFAQLIGGRRPADRPQRWMDTHADRAFEQCKREDVAIRVGDQHVVLERLAERDGSDRCGVDRGNRIKRSTRDLDVERYRLGIAVGGGGS